MKSIQKILLFLLFVTSGSSLFPFVCSYTHLKKGKKELFLLGDCHMLGKIDTHDRDLLLKYFSFAVKYDQPVTCILESNFKHCNDLVNIATERKLSTKEFYDKMTMITSCAVFNYQFPDFWKHENLDFFYSDYRSKKLELFYIKDDFINCTYEEYRRDLKPCVEKVSQYLSNYKDDYFAQNFQVYVDKFNSIISSHCRYDYQYLLSFLNCITDFNFYIDSVKAFEKKNKVIVMVGANHAEVLRNMYKKKGFEVVNFEKHSKEDYMPFMQKKADAPPHGFVMNDKFNRSLLIPERMKAIFGCDLSKYMLQDRMRASSLGGYLSGLYLKRSYVLAVVGAISMLTAGIIYILRAKFCSGK